MFIPSSLAARGPRLVASFFIFALSSGVVGGVIFYLDWTGPEVFQAGVQQVPVDMQLELTWAFYQQNATSLENITHIAQEQQYVTATEVVSCIQTWDYNQTNYEYSELTYLGVDDSLFHTFQNAIHLTPGSPQLNDSTCYVQKEMLGFWGTDVGKNLTFHAYSYDEHGNRIELNQTLRVVGVFNSQLFSHALYYLGPQISTLRVVTTRHSMSIVFGNPNGSGYASPEQQIWVALDRGAVIRSGAAVATTQLNDIARRIEQRVSSVCRCRKQWVQAIGRSVRVLCMVFQHECSLRLCITSHDNHGCDVG